ncbi:hypothetical protein [Actinokineospora enzanensis]|uniref:hypothetical protein n=1 Tax=Actinokineospora enzanensis TaxID=155975 RepID=UPI00037EA2C2|nr:hypothetical protein [Actinokineospora enzanensis]
MSEQLVGVDLRQGEYVVITYSQSRSGMWVLDGQPVRLPATADFERLGASVTDALDRSRTGLDDPVRGSKPSQPLLDAFGVTTYAAYTKGTRSVEVFRGPGGIEVTPQRNEGGRKGFTPVPDETRAPADSSPGSVGDAVITAFGKAS